MMIQRKEEIGNSDFYEEPKSTKLQAGVATSLDQPQTNTGSKEVPSFQIKIISVRWTKDQ